jgi:3-oxoacyl-[acyl-carrier-protein] synthase-1
MMLRTGLAGIDASPIDGGQGEGATMAFDATLDPLLTGEARASALARGALEELAAAVSTPLRSLRLRVALAFPEPYFGQVRSEAGNVLAKELQVAFAEVLGMPEVDADTRGSASLAYILPEALEALGTHQVDAIVVGGAHSDYDPAVIRSLADTGRLFSPENVDAVIPGECAAFALIGRRDLGARLRLPPLLDVVGVASETSDLTPYSEDGAFDGGPLAAVFRAATAALPDELRVGWAWGDHGLEHFRVRELYGALTRAHDRFSEPMMVDSPPQRMGRTGAGTLPLFLALAAEQFRRSCAPSPVGLLFAGSDGGERGAIAVCSP